MIDSITRITLNLQETNTMVSIRAKRGDTGRKLLIHLSDGSIPYHISDDCYATFTAKKPDGTKINNACTIENNVIEYVFTDQTCTAVGTMKAEIRLYGADDKMITSACFLVNVYDTVFRDGDEVDSEGEMNTLDALICEANELIQNVQQKLDNGEFIGPPGETPEVRIMLATQMGTNGTRHGVSISGPKIVNEETGFIDYNSGTVWDGTDGKPGTAMYTFDPDKALSGDGAIDTSFVNVPTGSYVKQSDLLLAPNGDVYIYEVQANSSGVVLKKKATFLFSIAGKNGDDGITPHIGENGNWWIGEEDTGVSARGQGSGGNADVTFEGETMVISTANNAVKIDGETLIL